MGESSLWHSESVPRTEVMRPGRFQEGEDLSGLATPSSVDRPIFRLNLNPDKKNSDFSQGLFLSLNVSLIVDGLQGLAQFCQAGFTSLLPDRYGALLGSERHYGIDSGCAARRLESRNQGGSKENCNDGDKRHRVVGRNPEEHCGHQPAGGQRTGDADGYTGKHQHQNFSQHGPQEGRTLRTQRGADPDFPRPPENCVGHQPVQTDRCQQQRQCRKEAG